MLILFLIAFFGFGFFNVYLSKFLANRNIKITLEQYAKNMNGECPHTIRDKLLLEKVYFIKRKTIVYEFKLLNYSKYDFDLQQLKENLIEPVIEEIESIKSLATLRNNDVVFVYHYFDSQREEMFKIKVLFNTPITIID
jgi:hypothetical protein